MTTSTLTSPLTPALVPASRQGDPWSVWSAYRAPGHARTLAVGAHLHLSVADVEPAGDERDEDAATRARRSCTRVDLRPDGSVRVETSAAPPVLVFGPAGVRTLPDLPGRAAAARCDGDQIVLACSAAVLDRLPCSIETLVRRRGGRDGEVRWPDLEHLADELLVEAGAGAVAVARWRPR